MRSPWIVIWASGVLWLGAVASQDPPGPLTDRMVAARGKGAEAVALYRAGLKDPDPKVRAAAVQLYWADSGMQAFSDLAPMAGDPDARVAQAAVLGMVPQSDPRVVEPIRRALRSAPDSTKAQIASAIGDHRDARFVEDLGSLLGDKSAGLRRVSVEAMRSIGSSDCVPHLMKATGDADVNVVKSALGALGTIGDPRALPRVVQLAGSKDPEIRAAAGEAVPALGGTAKYRETLVTLVNDPQQAVGISTLRGIAAHYSSDARPVLTAACGSSHRRIRESAILAMDQAPTADLETLLPAVLRDKDVDVRAAAIRRAGASNVPALFDAVVASASDQEPTVRAITAGALADYGREAGAPVLALLAGDTDATVRVAAVQAAGRVPGEATLAVLRKSVSDVDDAVRIEALRALANRPETEARAALRSAAVDKSPAVRATAITELARIRDDKAGELARVALTDPAEQVRAAAKAASNQLRGAGTTPKR